MYFIEIKYLMRIEYISEREILITFVFLEF